MPVHPLKWVADRGLLAEALGLSQTDAKAIESIVEKALRERWNLRKLLETVGELDISDELWANFLYTYGWWDGKRNA